MDTWLAALNSLAQGFTHLGWQNIIMVVLGCVLLYLGIARGVEPILLLPIGFGILLGNLPLAGLSAGYPLLCQRYLRLIFCCLAGWEPRGLAGQT